MKPPTFTYCAFVFFFRCFLILSAWLVVGLALLFGFIHKGAIRRGQHNGEVAFPDGKKEMGDKYPFEDAIVPWWLSWYDTPDEPGPFPAYEPTVMRVYRSCGWGITVWYNLATRNMAHGFLKWCGIQADKEYKNAELRLEKFGVGYGWKCYRDWYQEIDLPDTQTAPKYYLVPSFFNNER